MPKSSERGSVLIVLVLIFLVSAVGAGFFVYTTLNKTTQKAEEASNELSAVLSSEYTNPFDENSASNYENPFEEKTNPFNQLND